MVLTYSHQNGSLNYVNIERLSTNLNLILMYSQWEDLNRDRGGRCEHGPGKYLADLLIV